MNYQRIYTYILPILVLSCLSTTLFSQEISINPANIRFETNLDATKMDESCYQLTSNKEQAGGGVWYPETINLKEDFHIDLSIFLGCEDSLGADGMVFMISQKKILGGKGAGMGFLKLKPL